MASNHTTGQPNDGAMLQLEGVSTFYGPIQALDDVSLVVNRGEIVTLIGSNGAGKTTLLMTVCGNPRAATGHIRFEGQDIARLDTPQIMRNGIAISPEGRRVFADMTVTENLQMGGFFQNREEIEAGLEHAFNLFPRLRERAHQRAGTMSGGEQQMLAIGRALMSRPRLLLLDEPTLGLAPLIIAQIFEIIQKIRSEGVTVFLVEQNANRALQLADRGYVLENGRIVLEDSGQNLLANDDIRKAYLGVGARAQEISPSARQPQSAAAPRHPGCRSTAARSRTAAVRPDHGGPAKESPAGEHVAAARRRCRRPGEE